MNGAQLRGLPLALALGLATGLGAGCRPAPDVAPGSAAPPATPAEEPVLDESGRVALAAAVQAQQQGMPEAVGALLEPLLALDPPPADAQFVAGSAAYDLAHYGEAAERLSDAVQRKPEFLGAASALGFAWRRLGDYDASTDVFRRIVEVRPEAYKAHYGLGLVAVDQGRVADARAHLEEALALRPDYLKARFGMARVLIEEGRPVEAREALEAVLAAWPSHEQALYQLSLVLAELGETEEAERVLARREEVYRLGEEAGGLLARRRGGDTDPRISVRLTELYLALDEVDDARRELQLGLRADPAHAGLQALVPLVQAAMQQGAASDGSDDD
ncbi:MAG: tetratricopeptide repeat protein [Planctomycetota bacterium]